MNTPIRFFLVVTGLVVLGIGAGFFVQAEWALRLWPWQGYAAGLSPLSAIFLASISAAIAVPVLWIGLTGKLAATASGALNLLITSVGISIFMFQSHAASPSPSVLFVAILTAVLGVTFAVMFVIASRLPAPDHQPLPLIIRLSFAAFAIILLLTGGAMALKQPNIFPWRLTTEMSVVYGWIFLGAAAYFIHALVFPGWYNVTGQLAGFLAYDLVLIVPFMQHWGSVAPELRSNLAMYIGVLVYSGLLSAYYLFINPTTRLRFRGR